MRLVQLRVDAGLSRSALADASGITYQALSNIENLVTRDPQAATLRKLAVALSGALDVEVRASELLMDTTLSPVPSSEAA
jgi:transcriptional regulator with XRE-family HTH domain